MTRGLPKAKGFGRRSKILKIRLLLRPPKVLNLQAEDLAEGLIFRNEASKILKNFFYENLFLKKIHTLWVFQTSVYLWNFLQEGWKIKGRNTFYLIKHLSNLYQIDVSFLSFNQHGFDVQWERTCYEFFHEPKKPIESTICKIYIHDFI